MWRIVLVSAFGLGVAGAATACDGPCGMPVVPSACGCAPVVCPPCPCAPVRAVIPLSRPRVPLAVPPPAPPSTAEPPLAGPPPAPPSGPPPAPMPPVQSPPPPQSPEPPATLAPPTPAAYVAKASPARFYDVYRVPARNGSEKGAKRGRVSFWNLSGQDVVLKAGGRTQTLPRGRRVLLELERSFEWQVEGRAAEKATVATDDVGLEVVIRH